MGRDWLGLGDLEAQCWFIGMEPGGDAASDKAWAVEWATKFRGAPTVDLHACATAKELPYIASGNRLHPTWSQLVRLRLAYAGKSTDDQSVLAYQRDHFAMADGGEALLEVSAYASRNSSLPSPRKLYRSERTKLLAECIGKHHPEIVVFYSLTYRRYYERIAGAFDADGFCWVGDTLCALTLHPYQQFGKSPPPEYWITLGEDMRQRVEERRVSIRGRSLR
jgi:hypothetical protein